MLEKNHKYPPKPKTIDELIIALKTICEELLQPLKLHFCRTLCNLMLISIVLGLVSCTSSQTSQNAEKYSSHGFEVIQGHWLCHESNGHVRFPISETYWMLYLTPISCIPCPPTTFSDSFPPISFLSSKMTFLTRYTSDYEHWTVRLYETVRLHLGHFAYCILCLRPP